MNNQDAQIQIRIDAKTKNDAKKVLEGLGLDISTAVKMLCKQIVFTGTLPFEVRDVNGFTNKKRVVLEDALIDARGSKKSFVSAKDLLSDALK